MARGSRALHRLALAALGRLLAHYGLRLVPIGAGLYTITKEKTVMSPTPRTRRRQRLATRRNTITTSICLPRTLHRRASLVAVRDGLALTELYRRALAAWLGSPLAARRRSS